MNGCSDARIPFSKWIFDMMVKCKAEYGRSYLDIPHKPKIEQFECWMASFAH